MRARFVTALISAACLAAGAAGPAWAAGSEPAGGNGSAAGNGAAPTNPAIGPEGLSTMHGDAQSSDTTPLPGPGNGPVDAQTIGLGAACPTVLHGQDGLTQAMCTRIVDRAPVVFLLGPSGEKLAEHDVAKGSLLGGVYAYLDERDRMVLVDGNGDLLRIGHDRGGEDGAWRSFVAERTPLDHVVSGHCGEPGCDAVTSLMPDHDGRIWFATGGGLTGLVDTARDEVRPLPLGPGERVDNSISTAPEGMSVATNQALYLLRADESGAPQVVWRQPYDPGPARKPGQLSWGTGASPTFFGPRTGSEYVTITDNASPQEHLLVYDTRDARQVCSVPVLPEGASGMEDSPVARDNSVYVSSTYGYPYPATPEGAGPSEPRSAPFKGGMSRVDVRPDGSGCDLRWTNDVRSAAVPRLSTGDDTLYTTSRESPTGDRTTPFDRFRYTAIDPETGAVTNSRPIGSGFFSDTLQMVGVIAPGGVLYQGTTSGIIKVTPEKQS